MSLSEENRDETPERQIAKIFASRHRDNQVRSEHTAKWKSEHEESRDSEERINQLIDEAIEAARKARAADPEGYGRKRLETPGELEVSLKRREEEKKWGYAIPDNIGERMQTTEGFSIFRERMPSL